MNLRISGLNLNIIWNHLGTERCGMFLPHTVLQDDTNSLKFEHFCLLLIASLNRLNLLKNIIAPCTHLVCTWMIEAIFISINFISIFNIIVCICFRFGT